LFDKSEGLATTTFMQGINEMRALEGELERSIVTISTIDTARVHLVLPKRELFSRERQEPSASVVLHVRGNDRLGKQQIAAIQNLIATAVAGLKPSKISVIDQNGNLLARGTGDADDPFNGGTTADEQQVIYEGRLSRSVEEMLERSVGPGKARVEVHADMDFDRVTTTSEIYDPDTQVLLSTTSSHDEKQSNESGDTPITVKTDLPESQAIQGGAGGGHSTEAHTEELNNYQNSKRVTNQVRQGGVVKRVSVAVLLDGVYSTGSNGERTYQARSQEELDQFGKLVRSAIGFDEKRGDHVEVVNLRFAQTEEAAIEAPPIMFGLSKSDLFRASETLVLAVVAILVILVVIRPLVTRALETARETALASQRMLAEQAAAAAGLPSPMMAALPGPMSGLGMVPLQEEPESMIDISQVEGRVRASSMKKIGEIVDKHPEEAVAILRSWMYQNS
jgi:flagellar M-ring protein FliF